MLASNKEYSVSCVREGYNHSEKEPCLMRREKVNIAATWMPQKEVQGRLNRSITPNALFRYPTGVDLVSAFQNLMSTHMKNRKL